MDKQRKDRVKNNTWRFQRNKSDREVLHRLLTSLFILAKKHCNYAPLPPKPSVIRCEF